MGTETRPRDPMHRRGRQAPRTWNARARRFSPASQAQPMHLSDHRVSGHAVAEQARNLARAFAVYPMLLELFDYLVRPRHLSPRSSILAKGGAIRRIPFRRPARSPPGLTLTNTRFGTLPTTSRGPQGENYTPR